MKKLMIIAAFAALPTIALAQSQLGNGMGTQSSATPSSDAPNDPSNANKTPTGMSGSSTHHMSRSHTSKAHKMSKSPSSGRCQRRNAGLSWSDPAPDT